MELVTQEGEVYEPRVLRKIPQMVDLGSTSGVMMLAHCPLYAQGFQAPDRGPSLGKVEELIGYFRVASSSGGTDI